MSQSYSDSLRSLIQKEKQDTSLLKYFSELSSFYNDQGISDSAVNISERAVNMACKKLDIPLSPTENEIRSASYSKNQRRMFQLLASSFNDLGVALYYQSDFYRCLDQWKKALIIDEKIGDLLGSAKRYGNMSFVYKNISDFPKALEYCLKALSIDEKLNDKEGVAFDLANAGTIYRQLGELDKALSYYGRSIEISKQLGDEVGIGECYGNMALVYNTQRMHEKALQHYAMALKIMEKADKPLKIAMVYCNMGLDYDELKQYTKALECYQKSLEVSHIGGNAEGIARAKSNMATAYIHLQEFKPAFEHIYSSVEIADSIGNLDYLKENYFILSNLYEKSTIPLPDTIGGRILNLEQMRLRSKFYLFRYFEMRDSVFSQENKRQILTKEMNFDFEKKQAIVQAQHDQELAVQAVEKKRQRLYLFLIAAVAIFAGIIAFIIFRSLRTTKLQKSIIEKQKHEVELAKDIIEEKQKEIIDSINYAKRIQKSLMSNENYIEKTLKRLRK